MSKVGFDQNLVNIAKLIDKYYIPTRYTDAWPEGVPEDYYTLDEANEAIANAETVMEGVEDKWKSLKRE